MRIHVLGGFLGSGKTTVLMKLASTYRGQGKKVSILVNEIGDIGVDGATIQGDGYSTTELPDGCICCTLTTTLREAIIKIHKDMDPDVMIIEPTGLAIPFRIVQAVDSIKNIDMKMNIIGIVDAHRFHLFTDKRPKFIMEQIKDSDIILMNKIDIATDEERESTIKWIEENIGRTDILGISASNGTGMDEALEMIIND